METFISDAKPTRGICGVKRYIIKERWVYLKHPFIGKILISLLKGMRYIA